MRKAALLCAVCLVSLASLGQSPSPSPSDLQWARVQQIKPGATIHLRTARASLKCAFRSADAAALVCARDGDTTYQRAEIRSISISHRARSTAIGMVLGGGIGAVAGAASIKPDGILNRGAGAAIFGVPAALIGAAIGAVTDFSHSTLYRSH